MSTFVYLDGNKTPFIHFSNMIVWNKMDNVTLRVKRLVHFRLTFCKHTFSLDYFFKIMFKNENKNETDSKTPHCKQEAVVFRMRKSLTLIRSRVVVRCAVLHNCRR